MKIYYEDDLIKMTYGCIYVFRNKINKKCYVGQTIEPEKRYRSHINSANAVDETHFHRALRKYGIENFDYFLVFGRFIPTYCLRDILNKEEIYWISFFDSYKNGYNMTLGGDAGGNKILGMLGKHHSIEKRQYWSEIRKGVPNSMKGKKYPPEKRKNMGRKKGCQANNKGCKYPPEIREHMGAPKGTHRVYHEDGSFHMEK